MGTMKRMMLKSYKHFEPQTVEIPEPGKGEVLVKVSHLGVCGSDISAYYGKQPYIPFPIVLGHELSGYVEKIGPDTEALPVGHARNRTAARAVQKLPCLRRSALQPLHEAAGYRLPNHRRAGGIPDRSRRYDLRIA